MFTVLYGVLKVIGYILNYTYELQKHHAGLRYQPCTTCGAVWVSDSIQRERVRKYPGYGQRGEYRFTIRFWVAVFFFTHLTKNNISSSDIVVIINQLRPEKKPHSTASSFRWVKKTRIVDHRSRVSVTPCSLSPTSSSSSS